MAIPVILDCDTGTDDAVAIMLAALHPDLDLLGVTTVWGNHDVRHTTDNTLRVLDHVGRGDVPVHAGANAPFRPRISPLPSGRPELPPVLDLPAARSVGRRGCRRGLAGRDPPRDDAGPVGARVRPGR